MALAIFCLFLVFALILRSSQSGAWRCRRDAFALITGVIAVPVAWMDSSLAKGAAPPAANEAGTLFRRLCQGCHGTDGRGSRGGAVKDVPDFTRPAWKEKRTDAQLTVAILEGKGTGMPAFGDKLNEAQAKILVGHLRSLAPERPNMLATNSSSPSVLEGDFDTQFRRLQREFEELKKQMKELSDAEGDREEPPARMSDKRDAESRPKAPKQAAAVHYKQLCQRCHGADGKGVREKDDSLPDFTDRGWQERRSDAQLLAAILDGTKGDMPAFRDRLSRAEARKLVAYVRSFAPAKTGKSKSIPVEACPNYTDRLFGDWMRKTPSFVFL